MRKIALLGMLALIVSACSVKKEQPKKDRPSQAEDSDLKPIFFF